MTTADRLRRALRHRWWWAVALGLAVVVVLGYRHALGLGLLADDLVLVTQARTRHLGLSLLAVDREWVFYRPLVQLVWSAVDRLAGDLAWPYHVLSLVVHWLNCLLVVALVRRLAPAERAVAVGAGLLFALLPLQVEAVAWASSLYDLFATLFYLLALLLLLAFWRERRVWPFAMALLIYQLCLWSKETAFTWPLAAVVVAAAMPQRPRWRTVGLSLLPFAGLLALGLTQRLVAWGDLGGYRDAPRDFERFVWDKLASAFASLLVPLNRQLWPDPAIQLWWLAAAGLVLVGLLTLRLRRLFAFSMAWILVTVVPVLNLLPLGSGLENARLMYLPAVGASVGLAVLVDAVAGAVETAMPRLRRAVTFTVLLLTLSAVYLIALDTHFQPWQVASRTVADLPGQLHRLVSGFAPGSRLEVAGLPRVYRGAQVLNLGFDHAYLQRYGSWFDLALLAEPGELTATAAGDHFWLTVTEDADQATWHATDLLAVVEPRADVGATGAVVATWGPDDCDAWSDWTVLGAESRCSPGQGLRVQPADSDAGLVSPSFDVPAGHWLRVAVDVAPEAPASDNASLQLYWHAPENWFDESRSRRLPLAGGTAPHRYLVFVPPESATASPNQIRVDPTDRRSSGLCRTGGSAGRRAVIRAQMAVGVSRQRACPPRPLPARAPGRWSPPRGAGGG